MALLKILSNQSVLLEVFINPAIVLSMFILEITKKGALDSQPQVIKFIRCLPMVSGSVRVHQLFPPLKLVTMI
jgi:hypothetical protein